MTDRDRGRFGELMALLGEVFNEPVSAARVAGYWLALDDFHLPALEGGVLTVLRECRFFPRPAELRRAARRVDCPVCARARAACRTWEELGDAAHHALLPSPPPRAAYVVQDLDWWRRYWAEEDERTGRWRRRRVANDDEEA